MVAVVLDDLDPGVGLILPVIRAMT